MSYIYTRYWDSHGRRLSKPVQARFRFICLYVVCSCGWFDCFGVNADMALSSVRIAILKGMAEQIHASAFDPDVCLPQVVQDHIGTPVALHHSDRAHDDLP